MSAKSEQPEQKLKGEIDPLYVDTKSNISDSFTKVVPPATLESHYPALTGMVHDYQ